MGQFDGFPFLMWYLMLRWQRNTKRLEQDLVVDGLVFEVFQNCRDLGTFIN